MPQENSTKITKTAKGLRGDGTLSLKRPRPDVAPSSESERKKGTGSPDPIAQAAPQPMIGVRAPDTPPRPPPVPLDAELFWMIWNPWHARPRQRHPSLEAAITERDRLLAENPGQTFYVFEARMVQS
jgi:hypothetical protein